MDDDEEDVPTCPLCLEELDATDRAVKACQCGYQVCLWCLHTIRERLNRRCPACRTLYDEHNFKFDDFNAEQAAKEAKERKTAKKERERREKLKEFERERTRALVLSQQKAKSNLKHARILQRNLVYVIGLSLTLAREEVIRRPDMFGRFGRIIRALVNRSHPFNADAPGGPSISAYVQYARDTDAQSAVRGMSNAVYDGREIRCAIATTKYCDALIRNAQVSDPAATYHCGNPQCMYYHSTSHTDTVLTREEALARQYGPPPPAHLFVSVSSRRPTFTQHRPAVTASNSQTPAQPSTRSLTIRSGQPNSNAPHSLSSSPNNHNVNINSTEISLSNPPMGSASMSSPKTMPPSSPSASIHATGTAASSPRHSPPSSPPADRNANRRNRSPPPADLPRADSPPGNFPAVPLPSSATWASVQPSNHVSRSPVRRSRPLVIPPRRKGEPPPGFEDPSLVQSPTGAPSRPPGFDSSSPSNFGIDDSISSPQNEVSSKRVLQAASPSRKLNISRTPPLIGRPPGFGLSPPTRPRPSESTHGELSTPWLQEPLNATGHSFTQERRSSQVADIVPRPSTGVRDEIIPRGGLEHVLASIGGSLGVSSEIQHMQPPVSVHFDANGSGHVALQNPSADIRGSDISDSQMFGAQPEGSIDDDSRTGPGYAKPRVDSFPADLNRVIQTGEVPPGNFPSHTSVPANLSAFTPVNININIVRAAIALRGMRSQSRFPFAQGDSNDIINSDSQLSHTVDVGYKGNARQNTGIADVSAPHHGTVDAPESREYVDLMGSKKANVNSRQARSRFNFAYHGSSPPRDIGQVMDRVGVDATLYNAIGHLPGNHHNMTMIPGQAALMKGAKLHHERFHDVTHGSQMTESYVDPTIRQQVAEAKVMSVPDFVPSKWASDSNVRTRGYDAQVEEMHRRGLSAIHGSNLRVADGFTPASGLHGGDVRRGSNNLVTVKNDHMHTTGGAVDGLPPPGFRGATSGISPDTTAGDQTSANTGVATKVVPGGTRSEAKIEEIYKNDKEEAAAAPIKSEKGNEEAKKLTTENPVDIDNIGVANSSNSNSSGSVSVVVDSEDGRKRSHAQRKRDRKARQARETVGRERKVAKDSHNSNADASSADGSSSIRSGTTSSASIKAGSATTSNATSNAESNATSSSNTSNYMKKSETGVVVDDKAAVKDKKSKEDSSKHRSVSDLEREVEEARAIEAQLLDELTKINQRLELYGKDNRVPI